MLTGRMSDNAETERMRAREAERAAQEAKLADAAPDDEERLTHERRSQKAAYLAEKLSEQERAPDDA
jgi:hypothetical protein